MSHLLKWRRLLGFCWFGGELWWWRSENEPGLLHNRRDRLTGISANAITAELRHLNEDVARCHPACTHHRDRTGNAACIRRRPADVKPSSPTPPIAGAEAGERRAKTTAVFFCSDISYLESRSERHWRRGVLKDAVASARARLLLPLCFLGRGVSWI